MRQRTAHLRATPQLPGFPPNAFFYIFQILSLEITHMFRDSTRRCFLQKVSINEVKATYGTSKVLVSDLQWMQTYSILHKLLEARTKKALKLQLLIPATLQSLQSSSIKQCVFWLAGWNNVIVLF